LDVLNDSFACRTGAATLLDHVLQGTSAISRAWCSAETRDNSHHLNDDFGGLPQHHNIICSHSDISSLHFSQELNLLLELEDLAQDTETGASVFLAPCLLLLAKLLDPLLQSRDLVISKMLLA
jgi:hypothetical protein